MMIDNFKLLPADSITLRTAGEAYNTLAGYARTIFYKLTGERITREFMHLDSTLTQRDYEEIIEGNPASDSQSIYIFPNPVYQGFVKISIAGYSKETAYDASVFDSYGRMLATCAVTSDQQSVSIGMCRGYTLSLYV